MKMPVWVAFVAVGLVLLACAALLDAIRKQYRMRVAQNLLREAIAKVRCGRDPFNVGAELEFVARSERCTVELETLCRMIEGHCERCKRMIAAMRPKGFP